MQAPRKPQAPQPKKLGQHQGAQYPPVPRGLQGQMARVHLLRGGGFCGGRIHHRGRLCAIRQRAGGWLRWVQKPDNQDNDQSAPDVVHHHNQGEDINQGTLPRAVEQHTRHACHKLRLSNVQVPSRMKGPWGHGHRGQRGGPLRVSNVCLRRKNLRRLVGEHRQVVGGNNSPICEAVR